MTTKYTDFADIFSKRKTVTLPLHKSTDYSFELQNSSQLPK